MKKNQVRRGVSPDIGNKSMGVKKRAVRQKITRLREHIRRLDTLEIVLAVVGTMKAGKSSCINAIVGQKILPSRNRPMTTVPTLVRHKPGQQVPVLFFSNTAPIQRLIGKLSTAIRKASSVRLNDIHSDLQLAKLKTRIARGFKLKERYRGQTEVYAFLNNLNDLARIADIFKIEFPFDQFIELTDFPLIEVEFESLRPHDELGARGSFALLDTPGFNEAGISVHLRKIFREQLERSSAVLMVLDYTQLKSEAEHELIIELKAVAKHAQGRMFALVNKFDYQDVRSDGAEETVHYVSKVLLGESISISSIFAVSAEYALLAQRARQESKEGVGLTWSGKSTRDWRDDFGARAFGASYGRVINDHQEVLQASEDLWHRSRFEAPLSQIVRFCQVSAVKLALSSSMDQLQSIADLLDDDT